MLRNTHLDDRSGQGKGFDALVDGPKRIGVQIKNWKTAVGVDEVRSLAGALQQSQGRYDSALLVAWDLSKAGHEALSKIRKDVKIDFVKIDYFLDCFLISEAKEREIDDLLSATIEKRAGQKKAA